MTRFQFEAFAKSVEEDNIEGWAKWCGGTVVCPNDTSSVEFTNNKLSYQRVKVGGIILRYISDDGSIKYIGTDNENLL